MAAVATVAAVAAVAGEAAAATVATASLLYSDGSRPVICAVHYVIAPATRSNLLYIP